MNDLSDRDFLIKSQFLSLWRKAMTISLLFNIKRKNAALGIISFNTSGRHEKKKRTKRQKERNGYLAASVFFLDGGSKYFV